MSLIKIYNNSSSSEYLKFLKEHSIRPDIYYLPSFLKLDAEIQNGDFEVFTIQEGADYFVYPYVKIPLESVGKSGYDISSPYGYCGPICSSKEKFIGFENQFLKYANQQNFVSEFIRYHYEYSINQMFRQDIENIQNRKLVLLDLTQDWETIWMKEFSSTNRNLVRKLKKEGFEYEIVNPDKSLDEFLHMYYETMKNAGAGEFYFFSKKYFQELVSELNQNVFLARIVKDGITYSSSLFFESNGYVIYYLSARNLNHSKVPSSNLLLAETVKMMCEKGNKWFNFGGGNTNELDDRLFKFKKNFAKNYVDFFIGKRIHNQTTYDALTIEFIKEKGVEHYEKRKSTFFNFTGKMKDYNKFLVAPDKTVKEALELLNELSGGAMTLFVVSTSDKLIGTLTDGDIRRNLLKGKAIDSEVSEFMNESPFYLVEHEFGLKEIDFIKERKLELVPIVNNDHGIIRVVDFSKKKSILPLRAIIMAGGRGSRLSPMTDNVPKPLLKVGNKPIIEHNIDRLSTFGIGNITITLNYLGEQIQDYFGDGTQKGIMVDYIHESGEQLGTIGAVSMIENENSIDTLIMNSDLLTNVDYEDLYRFYKNADADMVVAAIPYKVKVPYAVLKTNEDRIVSFEEKPTYTYYSNAGIYIVKSALLAKIPKSSFYNATDLIEDLIKANKKVVYYTMVSYWLDIGKPEDFIKAQEDIKHIEV